MRFSDIDWNRPWLARFRAIGKYLAAHDDWIVAASAIALEERLCNSFGQPIRFVPQHSLPASAPYESHVAATGEVPTRDNLHDFFNALVWLHLPLTKRTLNRLQVEALDQSRSTHTGEDLRHRRGPQRDAATLFDENAAIFLTYDASLLQALREHDWASTLQRSPGAFFSKADVILFGHALIEKLVTPYKSITAHVWAIQLEPSESLLTDALQLAAMDQRLAAELNSGFDNSAFCHLPVLGVPGWWEGQDTDFYADTEVFRPKRQRA